MAPREAFKVHSLSKHIEDTKKGLSAEAQFNPRSSQSQRAGLAVKQEPKDAKAGIFGNNEVEDSSESSDSSDDESESGENLLKRVIATAGRTTTGLKRRSKEDEIADSDVERKASAKQAVVNGKETGAKKSGRDVRGEGSNETESGESSSKAKANGGSSDAAAAAAKKSKSSTSSSSSEEDSSSETTSSDDEEEEDEDDEEQTSNDNDKSKSKQKSAPAVAAPTASKNPRIKSAERVESTSTSSEEESSSSESESESESESDNAAKPAKKPAQESKEATSSSSSSESEASDEEGDAADESMHMSDRESDRQIAIPNFLGSDFTLRKGGDGANGADVVKVLSEANLQGKQFWYFTVPSNVPISVVQNLEIPMDRAQQGDRVFSHGGQDFGISFDSVAPKSSISILIPSGTGSDYRAAQHSIDQTMHVKRITQLGGAASSTAGPAPNRAPRPQPEGLKARYQPFGVSPPPGSVAASATPARNAKPLDDGRRGKRKHSGSEEDAVAASQQLQGETQSAAKKQKKQKAQRVSSPDLGSEPPSTVKPQTTIPLPTIPAPTVSFSGVKAPAAAAAVATPQKKATKKTTTTTAKPATPGPSSSQTLPPSAAKKQTPVPIPSRITTAVPLPVIPGSARPKQTPVPPPRPGAGVAAAATPATPSQKKEKAKKPKKGTETASPAHQEPPPSAQPAEKTKKASKSKSKQG